MVSIIRQQLMIYINIYSFLEDSKGNRREIIKENNTRYKNSLFPEMQRAYFYKIKRRYMSISQVKIEINYVQVLPDNNDIFS